MKNFSLPRLAVVLWFLNYTFLSMGSYIFSVGRHEIMSFVVIAAVMLVMELVLLGLIEDVA